VQGVRGLCVAMSPCQWSSRRALLRALAFVGSGGADISRSERVKENPVFNDRGSPRGIRKSFLPIKGLRRSQWTRVVRLRGKLGEGAPCREGEVVRRGYSQDVLEKLPKKVIRKRRKSMPDDIEVHPRRGPGNYSASGNFVR